MQDSSFGLTCFLPQRGPTMVLAKPHPRRRNVTSHRGPDPDPLPAASPPQMYFASIPYPISTSHAVQFSPPTASRRQRDPTAAIAPTHRCMQPVPGSRGAHETTSCLPPPALPRRRLGQHSHASNSCPASPKRLPFTPPRTRLPTPGATRQRFMHFAPFLSPTAGRFHRLPRRRIRTGFCVAVAPSQHLHARSLILLRGYIQNLPDAGARGVGLPNGPGKGALASYLRSVAHPPTADHSQLAESHAASQPPSSQAGRGDGPGIPFVMPAGLPSYHGSPPGAAGHPPQAHVCSGPPCQSKLCSIPSTRRAPWPAFPFAYLVDVLARTPSRTSPPAAVVKQPRCPEATPLPPNPPPLGCPLRSHLGIQTPRLSFTAPDPFFPLSPPICFPLRAHNPRSKHERPGKRPRPLAILDRVF